VRAAEAERPGTCDPGEARQPRQEAGRSEWGLECRWTFEDDPDPAKARLLLRLWYNVRGGRTERLQTPEQRRGYFTQAPPVIQLDAEAAA